jgi:hypothetical protein
METTRPKIMGLLDRVAIGVLVLLTLLLLGIQVARAGEFIPAVGLTKSVDTDQAKVFGSVAFRGDLLPILKSEIGIAYRSEDRFDDRLKVRMWPVTASLWVAPIPALYAGGGVGWYHTTFDYDQDRIPFPVSDETKQEFGVHLGGGVKVPLTPVVGLDLHGRYVMMRKQDSRLVPEKFSPDFWSSSLGLALHF